MSVLVGVLLALHLIGWAVALGGLVATMKKPTILAGVLHGLYLALVTGLAITGVAGAQDWDLNYVKIGVKLVVALAVVALAIVGKNRPEKVTTGYLGGTAGLIVVNVFLAVLWK
ncbi:hypothetical protein C8046_06735 [Serinibacter arcticus]|uniref:Integral membrane protein n=1 Tax=Serinibacter arcticus TaxID=1655435 RepID=A0A2U1ZTV1_9MICO|nr:hypothetical protein [Serinibacter arcticus]PWD50391.1 hypothetical protein C8046_06735 [Serinibacter arcticus]